MKGMIAMNVERVSEEYMKGTRVVLNEMAGEDKMPSGLRGTVTSVDDMGQIHVAWDNGSSLALSEGDSFSKADTMKVLLVKPGEEAKMIEIDDSLSSMQQAVGGMIEEYMPFDDDVAIVCNEEGKLMGLPPSRAIYGDDGDLMDVMSGTFFVCYAPIESEKFLSLPPDMEKKYTEMFKSPEEFFRTSEGIKVVKMEPKGREKLAGMER
jgi:hypothetical protein